MGSKSKIFIVILAALSLFSCATMRKISVGRTLQKCEFAFESFDIIDAKIGKIPLESYAPILPQMMFAPMQAVSSAMAISWNLLKQGAFEIEATVLTDFWIVNPNSSYDTLWIRDLQGRIYSDTNQVGHIKLPSSAPVALPRDSSLHKIVANIQLNQKIVPLIETDSALVHIDLVVSTIPDGEPIVFSEKVKLKLNLPSPVAFVEEYGARFWEYIFQLVSRQFNL